MGVIIRTEYSLECDICKRVLKLNHENGFNSFQTNGVKREVCGCCYVKVINYIEKIEVKA